MPSPLLVPDILQLSIRTMYSVSPAVALKLWQSCSTVQSYSNLGNRALPHLTSTASPAIVRVIVRDYQLIDGLNSVNHYIPSIKPWLSVGTTYNSTVRSHFPATVKGKFTVRSDVTTDLSARWICNGFVVVTAKS